MGSELPEHLNPAELEVLGILWNEAPLKPAQIQEAFSRPIENATLRSVLRGLVEQGLLSREREGKAYFYSPASAPQQVRRKITDRLASVFAEGSRVGLIAQLIKDEKLSAAELDELKKLANEGE